MVYYNSKRQTLFHPVQAVFLETSPLHYKKDPELDTNENIQDLDSLKKDKSMQNKEALNIH